MHRTFNRNLLPPETLQAMHENVPDLSICLVNWNTRDLLRDCIHSIYNNSGSLSVEIFVIDNASRDGSAEMIMKEFDRIVLIVNPENRGFACANNQGIALSSGRNILLINPDTLVLPGALEQMTRFLDQTPNAGAVAAKLFNQDRSLQYSLRRFPTYLTPFTENPDLNQVPFMRKHTRRSQMAEWDHNEIRSVDQPAGAALMIKRVVIETLGTLDKSYHMFFEDVDVCYRIKRNGWLTYYLPEAGIVHYGGRSVRQRHNVGEEFYRSLIIYFRSHHGRWGENQIRASMIAGSLIYLAYAFFRYAFVPRKAFSLAKTALMVLGCGLRFRADVREPAAI
ncbi:glycosyltransferase family 2 protein [bacterium]|nr:glycosyltransferase family 2 protein [candidate division CSSED10-310 bacterium]